MTDRTRAAWARLEADVRLSTRSRKQRRALTDAALNFGLAAHELTCTPCWAGKTDQCPEYRRLQELPLGLNPHEPARAEQRKERTMARVRKVHKSKGQHPHRAVCGAWLGAEAGGKSAKGRAANRWERVTCASCLKKRPSGLPKRAPSAKAKGRAKAKA